LKAYRKELAVWSIAAAVLATVFGLVAIGVSILLFSRDSDNSHAGFWSRWGLGAFCILLAGCLLGVGGQYKLYRLMFHQADQATAQAAQAGQVAAQAAQVAAQARLQAALQEAFDMLTVRVYGPDPFRDQADACALQLRITTKAGHSLVSEVPQTRLKAVPNAVPDCREYLLAWQSLVEGPTTPEGRAVAGRILHVGDWRRIARVEADVTAHAAQAVPMPVSLEILANENPSLSVFRGRKASEEVVRQGDTWVCAYRDDASPADHLTVGLEAPMLPQDAPIPVADELGSILASGLAAGVVLLAIGIGLRSLAHVPDLEACRRALARGLRFFSAAGSRE
jgi:hypothetical protein